MIAIVTLILLAGSIGYLHAQEDRELPPLFEVDAAASDIPAPLQFQERAVDPIVINVRRESDKVLAVGRNNALYPYTLKFRLTKIRNLVPNPDSVLCVLYPGTRLLMNFKILDPTQDFDFNFTVDKHIGDVRTKPIGQFPYLIPLAKNRLVKAPSNNLGDSQYMGSTFMVERGDTIHVMRKGTVTALPATNAGVDRIAKNSIEVLHLDGTILMYEGIDPSKILVTLGDTVYPGQIIGVASYEDITVSLFQISNDKLMPMEILFYVNHNQIVPFSQIQDQTIVKHPNHIITQEMNKKERKRITTVR